MSAVLHPGSTEPLRLLQRPVRQIRQSPTIPSAPTPAVAAARAPWLERLATWAERQPAHHRMGSVDAMRR